MFELHVGVEEHKEATRHGNEDSDAKQNGLNRFISYKVIIKNEKPILFNYLECIATHEDLCLHRIC